MDFLGILGITAGFALLMLLTYRGWSVYLASFAGAAVVVLCAGLPLAETLTQKYIGGIGSIPGAMIGGVLLGVIEKICLAVPVLAPYTTAVEFSLLILILLVRPIGLLGKKRREKV